MISYAAAVTITLAAPAESPKYFVYVSNERSGDVSVIDGATDAVVATFGVGKRPRGIHATPDGRRILVTLSGSPRMTPGVDTERAPAEKTADGLGVIDPVARKLADRWRVGSDPEQFAISGDGKFAFIANEDDASALIVDLDSGQPRGKIKVSAEPEGVGVNPVNGEVYVTCEDKGEVFAISPGEQCRTVPAFTSRAKAADTLPLSMPGRTNCCQKFSCRQARCPWVAQFREAEKSFMSQPVEGTQSQSSIRRRTS